MHLVGGPAAQPADSGLGGLACQARELAREDNNMVTEENIRMRPHTVAGDHRRAHALRRLARFPAAGSSRAMRFREGASAGAGASVTGGFFAARSPIARRSASIRS